jgi:phosphatidylserine/phosphatidylglycerophosphate/cardiolipin synthase-like enzyme/uncharacterized membrane protein YdjX (TVP38/TMEM64 family)
MPKQAHQPLVKNQDNQTGSDLVSEFFQPGVNCWRTAKANRAAFLIDAADYFAAFRAAAEQARHSILIIGWDIDSRICLVKGQDESALPGQLGPFLNSLVKRRPRLDIRILVWDFAMIYALEREPVPLYKRQWRPYRHIDFKMDDTHPFGASHHQKIIVIDDALAFSGGIDLTRCRWDTSHHHADNPHRVDVNGKPYAPFHDVQMMVDGDMVVVLGELARARWQTATGQQLAPTGTGRHDLWPKSVAVAMQDVELAVARTLPGDVATDMQTIQEVERLYQDAIGAAQHSIYMENQYLTSQSITKALIARLQEPDGPEIIIVLPRETDGWLEKTTMDVLRARQLKALRQTDPHQRLRIYYPALPDLPADSNLIVHGKVLIVDDWLARVGSANLSNRSMGLDTECDLAVAANDRADIRDAICAFRNRLLGEHLGVKSAVVANALAEQGSLIQAIEHLRGGQRTLHELDGSVPEALDKMVPEAALLDPEKPLDLQSLTEHILPMDKEDNSSIKSKIVWIKGLTLLIVLLGMAAAWRWTPLGEWLNADNLANWATGLQSSPWGPVVALGSFLIGSIVAFPITVLIVVSSLVFGPLFGFIYALVGSAAGAALTYGIGHWLGRDTVRRLGGSRLNRLSRQMAERGIITVAIVRMVPIAPFTLVNMVAGASFIQFRDFMLGTVLGMGPGMLGLTVFADGVYRAFRNPQPTTIAWVAAITVALIAATMGLHWWINHRQETRALTGKQETQS